MAARWGVGEENLTTGTMEFFTTYTFEEGDLSGEANDLALDSHLDSEGGLEPFNGCLDPSILSIFEDSVAGGEAKGRAEEESEATLLTALTEILDNVDDENLSPFDTLPDSELFSGQKGREQSPLRRLLSLARSPPGREPIRSPKSSIPLPAKSEGVGVERPQRARILPRAPDAALQRSDGEEEEEDEGRRDSVTCSEGQSSTSADVDGTSLDLDQNGRCVAMSLSALVRHMHPYCLAVCVEPGEGEGQEELLPKGAIVLEVVEQGDQGEAVLAIAGLSEDAGFQQKDGELISQDLGGSLVSKEGSAEKASEERPRGEEFGKYSTGRKKKRKSNEGGGEGVSSGQEQVLRSTTADWAEETNFEMKAQTTKKKKRVTFAPILTSFLEDPISNECGSEKTEALGILEDGDTDSVSDPLLPGDDILPCKVASIHKGALEPKPRPLSLQQYRLLRQQKKPAPVRKQEDHRTKWPSLPELPTELPPIPCLVETKPPQDQPAGKTMPVMKPAWQPVGTNAPPTPQALLIPLRSVRSSGKGTAASARPASQSTSAPCEPTTSPNETTSNPPLNHPDAGGRKPQNLIAINQGGSTIGEGPISSNKAVPPQSNTHIPDNQINPQQKPLSAPIAVSPASTSPINQASALNAMRQAQHVQPSQTPTESPKPHRISSPMKNGELPPQAVLGPTARGRPQRAAQKRLTPVQMPSSAKRNPRISQNLTNEIGIEATDLTSLLEQFEETQAKEEQRVPEVCGGAAAVGSSSFEQQHDRKPLEHPRGPDLGSTAGLTPPATPPHQPNNRAGGGSPTTVIPSLASKPPAPKEHSAFVDHDYCRPSEDPAQPQKDMCHSGRQQQGASVELGKGTSPTTMPQHGSTAAQDSATTTATPAKLVSQPLDHRTLTGSVLLSPDSSPCRLEEDGNTAPILGGEHPKDRTRGTFCFSEHSASPLSRERGRTRRRRRGHSSSSESSSSESSSQSSSGSRSRSRSTSRSRSRSDSRSPPRKRFRSRRSESSSSGSSRSSSCSLSRSPPRYRRYSYSSSRSRSWSRSRSRSCSPRDRRHHWWTGKHSPSRKHRYRYNSVECFQRRDVKERKEKAIEERRVVYVGRIRGGMTRKELKERFAQYGDIEECTLHFRDYGDNYGFVTYYNTKDAFNAIENGSKLRQSDELPFDLCFGGRRQFCKSNYSDLDSNREYDPVPSKSKYDALDFDTLLKQAQKGLKR
ncbi:hypothetical protein AGOR_G00202010 [Albula goreensis]|uniref:RRM domain-containing protein n=1 Tax=Albula goreensis TaxID=1534307 RepID=A0A8T3CTJ6_9TELE|nr:hypothetical protein AGOR_G00202010 [Albula goreensis]